MTDLDPKRSPVWVDRDSLTGMSMDGCYEFVMDHGAACDVEAAGINARCRLPSGHDGQHLWFAGELVDATGVRVRP